MKNNIHYWAITFSMFNLVILKLFRTFKFNTRDQLVALLILVICASIKLWDPAPIQNLRLASFDQLQKSFY